MDIKLRAKSWATILAVIALVTLLGHLSRPTYFGSLVLFGSAILLFIILIIYTLQRTNLWQFHDKKGSLSGIKTLVIQAFLAISNDYPPLATPAPGERSVNVGI